MKLDWGHWLYGLFAALIGGGAGSISATYGASLIAPGQFGTTGDAGWNSLKLVGFTFVASAVVAVAAYLKQSPLPSAVATVTETTSTTVAITPKDPPSAT
jgi:hypothetical protein